ncbi:MAG: YciI family protein [Candidatus Sericytochromatia bacterium]
MKHFLVELKYLVDISKIDEILKEHREFLQTGYDKGLLLCSGPKNPREGGVIIARDESLESLQSFFKQDPYSIENYAEYKFTEFTPVKYQGILKDWV